MLVINVNRDNLLKITSSPEMDLQTLRIEADRGPNQFFTSVCPECKGH
jgi:hypothetical protein